MEQNNELAKTLEQIGLKEKETQVYLALLSLESSTAYEIAQHCEVKRPTVYVILEDLRQKGLVLKIPHAKKALYAARDIGEYLAEQRGKLNAVESILPRLMSLGGSQKPNVYFFNGVRGMSEALKYKFEQMRGKIFYSFYGSLEGSDVSVLRLYEEWDRQAVASDMRYQIIMSKKDGNKYHKHLLDLAEQDKERFSIKFLEEYSYPGNISIEIGDDFVRIDDAKHITATVIDDKATAAALKQIFDIVWQKGV